MTNSMHVGYVAKSGEDVLPSTGPHLDVRVLKDGQYIDPSTWRSGLQRLKIGSARTPLYRQQGDKWSPGFAITSGYGPRVAPTAGASTDHKGIDYGIAGGEQLFWEGPGTFKPGKGYGSITTPEGYEVRLLHTKGGKETQLQPTQQTTVQPQPQTQLTDAFGTNVTYNFYVQPKKRQSSKDYLTSFIEENLQQQKESPLSANSIYKMLTSAAAPSNVYSSFGLG
jgi:hypothetical protein